MRWGELWLDGLINCSDLCIGGTFVMVYLNMKKTRSAAGMSLQTLATVVGARVLHLISHGISLHYQPTVLPWFIYPTVDVINAIIGVLVLYSFVTYYYLSYEKSKDNFGIHFFEKFKLIDTASPLRTNPFVAAMFMYGSVAVIALLWYFVRRSQHTFLISYFCCYYEVMGGVALIPQLWMFHQDKRVSPLLAYFVVLTALNRLCTLMFWICYPRVFYWRYPDNRGIQMASECVNLLILSDFLFYWARSKIRGDKEILIGDGIPDV
eukprot:TRINITY_DN31557_c0_g1_i1.p1 TRINITY_DN31557_c0_g1~~TRINITY_DN31557_c0_g1_i1.p1  ORF type:complete len:265 (-),score=8.44 TRINITY_DN31557_c0_g1_i1:172-966(-)